MLQNNNFSDHTIYKILQAGNGTGYTSQETVELRGSPDEADKAAGLEQPYVSPYCKTHTQGHILPPSVSPLAAGTSTSKVPEELPKKHAPAGPLGCK